MATSPELTRDELINAIHQISYMEREQMKQHNQYMDLLGERKEELSDQLWKVCPHEMRGEPYWFMGIRYRKCTICGQPEMQHTYGK